jgi:hypothetical protein
MFVEAVIAAVGDPAFTIVTECVIEQPFASVMVQVYVPAARLDAVAPVPPDGAHEKVYPGVPPAGVTVAEPVGLPQIAVTVVDVAVTAVGWVTVTDEVIEQPFASVMVHVYVPAARLDAVAPVPPDGAHEYVYPGVPFEATTEAVPVVPPLHRTGVVLLVAVTAVGCVTVVVAVIVQPFASVTVHV